MQDAGETWKLSTREDHSLPSDVQNHFRVHQIALKMSNDVKCRAWNTLIIDRGRVVGSHFAQRSHTSQQPCRRYGLDSSCLHAEPPLLCTTVEAPLLP
jgi:hypothetical protein